jgi:type IV pilus assembly protein PilV
MRVRDSQAGVMLIEALIGILIFSIGILALIGMQAAAMRNTTDAKYRSEAGFLASQIVSQMWVDRGNLANYATAGTPPAFAPRDTWQTRVATLLPGGVGVIEIVAPAANNEVQVTLTWQQPGEVQTRQFQMSNRINGGA